MLLALTQENLTFDSQSFNSNSSQGWIKANENTLQLPQNAQEVTWGLRVNLDYKATALSAAAFDCSQIEASMCRASFKDPDSLIRAWKCVGELAIIAWRLFGLVCLVFGGKPTLVVGLWRTASPAPFTSHLWLSLAAINRASPNPHYLKSRWEYCYLQPSGAVVMPQAWWVW